MSTIEAILEKFNLTDREIEKIEIPCNGCGGEVEYTDEYRNENGNVQADRICKDCGEVEMAWIGPSAERIEEACDITVPTKEEVYEELQQ